MAYLDWNREERLIMITMKRCSILLIACGVLVLGTFHSTSGQEHAYVGNKKCKMCHLKEWKSWNETKMANTLETLKPGARAGAKKAAGLDPDKDYTKEAECLACHTTGYGKPGGFVDVESTPELVGVGCESCHGAGETYTKAEYMSLSNKEYKKADVVAVGMVDQVSEALCRECHNNESPFVGEDYVFDFEANKEKGTHEKFALKYPH
jgi:Cytochrome c554 and c-prime